MLAKPDTQNAFVRVARQFLRYGSRAIGAGFVAQQKRESPKILVSTSKSSILGRCCAHSIPATVSIILVTINLCGYYIGPTMSGTTDEDDLKLGVLQVCAKAQELLIVGSVGTIVLHALQFQLIHKSGVPLGLIESSFSFTSLSYFWSTEFLGAVKSRRVLERRVFLFIALVVISGIIAVMAGPSAAVLMIPKRLNWQVGGAIFWMNGTTEQLWPSLLTAADWQDIDCSNDEARLGEFACPSSGMSPLFQHFRAWTDYVSAASELSFELQDSQTRKMFRSKQYFPSGDALTNYDAWATTTHASTGRMQDIMRSIYDEALHSQERSHPMRRPAAGLLSYSKVRTFKVPTEAPAVRTACSSSSLNFTLQNPITMSFPVLPEFETRWGTRRPDMSWTNPNGTEKLHDVSDAVRTRIDAVKSIEGYDPRYNLIIAPCKLADEFQSVSLGLVLLTALDEAGQNWTGTACSVDARWAASKSVINDNWFDGQAYDFPEDQGVSLLSSELLTDAWAVYTFAPPNDGTWRRVAIDLDWFDLLSPALDDSNYLLGPGDTYYANQTMIEKLASRMDFDYTAFQPEWLALTQASIENIISTVFADGMSRAGAQYTTVFWDMVADPLSAAGWPDSDEAQRTMIRRGDPIETFSAPDYPNITRKVMHSYLSGYVMATVNWFDYLCVAVLLLHILLAFGHICWLIWYRETSDSWDTITELLALSQKSPPPEDGVLDNTGAGVRSFSSMSLVGWVDVAQGSNDPDTSADGRTGKLRLRIAESGLQDRKGYVEVKKDVFYR